MWIFEEGANRKIKVDMDGHTLEQEDIYEESMELDESICSEETLRFGCCEASIFKLRLINRFMPVMGKKADVSFVGEDSEYVIGSYRVRSDVTTADLLYRDIVAYDAMYDIINADVAEWYNSVLPEEGSTMTLKQFRESFIRHFGLTEVLPEGGLVNDGMVVGKTIMPEQISGKDVITAICEINGCFGHIGRDGKFHYIYLPQAIQGLWPADDLFPNHTPPHLPEHKLGTLYPHDPKSTKIGSGSYISCKYEDFITQGIDKLQIRKEEDDIGLIYGSGNNCYIIEDNFLVYGKSSEQLSVIAANIYNKIIGIVYRPFSADCVGNPCLEVGDPVRLPTRYEIVESYILSRTMKGIQALRDSYTADGVEQYGEKVNGVHKSIIQLKGKANILSRTIEETRLEMYDIEKGLYNTISVTAREIRSELKNTKDGLESTISQTASEIRAEVANADAGLSSRIAQNANSIIAEVKRATTEEGKLSASIKVEADRITAEVKRASDSEGNLSSRITQNADGITAEVKRAKGAEGTLSASIKVNADNISLKVSKASVISEINQSAEKITIRANKIDLQGLVTATEFTSKYATIDTLDATTANLNSLISQRATIDSLNAVDANLKNLIAEKASVSQLDASNARIGNLEVDHVSISDFISVSAQIDNLNANKLNASTAYVDFMEVGNWTSAGYIKADRIDADSVAARISSSAEIKCKIINVSNAIVIGGSLCTLKNLTIDGTTYKVIGA